MSLLTLLLVLYLLPEVGGVLLGLLLGEDAYRRRKWEERQRKAKLAQRLQAKR